MSQKRFAPGSIRQEITGKHDVNQQDDERFWADIGQEVAGPLHQQLAVKHVVRGPVQSQRAWEIFNELKGSVGAPIGDGRAEEDHG